MKFLKALKKAGTTRYILFKNKKLRYAIRGSSAVLRHVDCDYWGLNVWWPSLEEHQMDCWKVGDIING